MLIALDYDGTYTADPELWDSFIALSRERGHRVIIATMRYPTELSGISSLIDKVDDIIFTSRKAKKPFVIASINENPHIWIDDNPEWLFTDSL